MSCSTAPTPCARALCISIDFDHQFIETEKYDAKPTYKKFLGYSPGVAVIQRPELPLLSGLACSTRTAVQGLHARWAAEEAAIRRSQPDFNLQKELRSPEMRRLMQLPGMRVQDAYRLAHYDENLRTAAQAVEQGVVERIQQRAARPTEKGIRPGGAATVRPDVASMTRAQREALERRVLHGAQIEL